MPIKNLYLILRFLPNSRTFDINILSQLSWARIFKRLWSPRIDSKELIPSAYVARYDNPTPTRFLTPIDCFKIPGLVGKWSQFPTSVSSTSVIKIQKITDYSNKQ